MQDDGKHMMREKSKGIETSKLRTTENENIETVKGKQDKNQKV